MAKIAIKNENITSFGGIYHIMDVFSKLGFEKLTESVLGKCGSSGKAFCYGSIFGSLFFSYLCGGECLEDINALIGQLKQRPDTLLPAVDTVGVIYNLYKPIRIKLIIYKILFSKQFFILYMPMSCLYLPKSIWGFTPYFSASAFIKGAIL